MTWTTPDLALPLPNFRAIPTGGRLATTYDLAWNRPRTRQISVESGFEPATLRSSAMAGVPNAPVNICKLVAFLIRQRYREMSSFKRGHPLGCCDFSSTS
ncbi:hypothetical protein AVEN_203112-1 [Araneus ventricosus]|uniref:Uncharacterized protein n=1 Tax=Araneus ventricosus TaxID=182803 RepID=A0A4Y2DRF0_ARAVE|nr:hypothetical protein AVEN_203112-1 [Araneus ventricosus]